MKTLKTIHGNMTKRSMANLVESSRPISSMFDTLADSRGRMARQRHRACRTSARIVRLCKRRACPGRRSGVRLRAEAQSVRGACAEGRRLSCESRIRRKATPPLLGRSRAANLAANEVVSPEGDLWGLYPGSEESTHSGAGGSEIVRCCRI